jgi:hypothetical protein
MEQCTFRPLIHPLPPSLSEPREIKGMEEHLWRRKLVEERKLQQQEREEQVFLTNLPPKSNRRYTIPEPFTLSSGRGARRASRAVDEDDEYDY